MYLSSNECAGPHAALYSTRRTNLTENSGWKGWLGQSQTASSICENFKIILGRVLSLNYFYTDSLGLVGSFPLLTSSAFLTHSFQMCSRGEMISSKSRLKWGSDWCKFVESSSWPWLQLLQVVPGASPLIWILQKGSFIRPSPIIYKQSNPSKVTFGPSAKLLGNKRHGNILHSYGELCSSKSLHRHDFISH